MNESEKERLRLGIKDVMRIQSPEKVLYYEKEKGIFAFLDDLSLKESETIDIKSDYERLFPYAHKRELDFDAVLHIGGNVVFLDVLDTTLPKKTLSSLTIQQYEDWIKKESALENIPSSLFPYLVSHFHSLVEKLMFVQFLRNERHLNDKALRFDIAVVFFDTGSIEDYSLANKINYVERTVIEKHVEKLGILEKGTGKALRLVHIR